MWAQGATSIGRSIKESCRRAANERLKVWMNIDLKTAIDNVRPAAKSGLEYLRSQLATESPLGRCSVGEHVGERAATWWLSIILTADGDELCAIVNVQIAEAGVELSADVSLAERILYEHQDPTTECVSASVAFSAFFECLFRASRCTVD